MTDLLVVSLCIRFAWRTHRGASGRACPSRCMMALVGARARAGDALLRVLAYCLLLCLLPAVASPREAAAPRALGVSPGMPPPRTGSRAATFLSSAPQLAWQLEARAALDAQRAALHRGTRCSHRPWAGGLWGAEAAATGGLGAEEVWSVTHQDQQGQQDQQGAAGAPLELLLLTLVRGLAREFRSKLFANRAAHAALHARVGYCEVDWQVTPLGDSVFGQKFAREHAAWSRVVAMRQLAFMADWVLWLDADALILAPEVSLAKIVRHATERDKHVLFATEPKRGSVRRQAAGEECTVLPPFVSVDGHLWVRRSGRCGTREVGRLTPMA